MVREVEEFTEEDKKVKERIDACNSLETYIYNMKNQFLFFSYSSKGQIDLLAVYLPSQFDLLAICED